MDTTLIVPGLYGSGVDHWQSWFQSQVPDCVRVVQSDWSVPDLTRWSARVRRELHRAPGRVWIVAHSFGCLASVDVAADSSERIAGMMLVAPADPARFGLQKAITRDVLGVHSIVVASTNDRWMSINDAESWSDSWGSQLINLGAVGHINVSSGHGPWPRGLDIYRSLRGRTSRRASARRSDEDVLELGDI
ncbi:MAG: RBBP9/YdeN family alpha/beta hydrolase [Hyphomicrobium sp.]|jgi:predicted alpha/beta hydrolase family esterase